ncbi:MAG TPA: cysteine--tRNA ligase [bacterium]|jgi:cysteinyl-tRNA synthetase
MSLRFYNTLTRQVDEFVPRDAGKVAMYSCGPTVYDRAHIGNFRAFLFVDLLRRYLKYRGYQVFSVMNLTDIDDKTIRGAQKEGVSLREFTDRFIQIFFDEWDVLRIQKADLHPRATDHIPEMVNLVQTLTERGHAYEADRSYYYKVETFPTYGQFARLDMSGMRLGERVASDEYEKESARDFALWKGWGTDDGDVFWDTALGKGRPGWHLECSAMSLKYLGKDFDIHTGGVDLIFPHHQNEIAQTEGVTDKRLARYWLHNEHLLVEGAKMSKSLGNFYTLEDLTSQGWKPREIRYALLSAHYRQKLNFTQAGLEAARGGLERIDACVRNLKFAEGAGAQDLPAMLAGHEAEFVAAMDDDLNYPNALAVLFNLIRDVNTLCAEQKIGPTEAEVARGTLRKLDSVFGFLDVDQAGEGESDEEIELLIQARNEARKAKDWAAADRIRQELADRNVIIEDRAGGTVWHRK